MEAIKLNQSVETTERTAGTFWSRLFSRWRGKKLRGMARVRVYARAGQGNKVPMVGLLPRESLDEIRRRFAEARRTSQGPCYLEASPRSVKKVRVMTSPRGEPQAGWQLVLGMRVREGEEQLKTPLRSRVRVELEDLIPRVELVAESVE